MDVKLRKLASHVTNNQPSWAFSLHNLWINCTVCYSSPLQLDLWKLVTQTDDRLVQDGLRVDLNPRISKICASWMSVWNISANCVLVPLEFNLNWNIWKPSLKTSPLDFSGQRLGNTSLFVFLRFHCLFLEVSPKVEKTTAILSITSLHVMCKKECKYAFMKFKSIANDRQFCHICSETKNLGDDLSATSCKTGMGSVFPLTPLGRSTAGWLSVGRDVTVALSTKSLRYCFHIQKDAWWAGDSPGISLETNGRLLFLLIDNWFDKIILVPGSGQRLFHVKVLVPSYTNLQDSLNCFLVRPYLKYLTHYLPPAWPLPFLHTGISRKERQKFESAYLSPDYYTARGLSSTSKAQISHSGLHNRS